MLIKFKILILMLLIIGCATVDNTPESERIPNEFDGKWEFVSNNRFYMYFNVKYGKIIGKMGLITWPIDIHLPIRGKVSQDGEFKFEHAGHPDVTNGYNLEVTYSSSESDYIKGNAYDDFNKRFTWTVYRK